MSKQAQREGHLDLVRLWEDHIRHEFETRSTDDTLRYDGGRRLRRIMCRS